MFGRSWIGNIWYGEVLEDTREEGSDKLKSKAIKLSAQHSHRHIQLAES